MKFIVVKVRLCRGLQVRDNLQLLKEKKWTYSGFGAYDEQAQESEEDKSSMDMDYSASPPSQYVCHDDELSKVKHDFYVFSESEDDINDRKARELEP